MWFQTLSIISHKLRGDNHELGLKLGAIIVRCVRHQPWQNTVSKLQRALCYLPLQLGHLGLELLRAGVLGRRSSVVTMVGFDHPSNELHASKAWLEA